MLWTKKPVAKTLDSLQDQVDTLNSNLESKTGVRDVGLVEKNTQIVLTDAEKTAKLLIAHFVRYGRVKTAILTASVNYISGDNVVPSFGEGIENIKILATGQPVVSISFTGTDTAHNVTIIRIM